MIVEKFFHLDCNQVIPECGCTCGRCIAEIRSALESRRGVSDVILEKRGEAQGILVRYDMDVIGVEEILSVFRNLPSFYRGRFVPKVLDAQEKGLNIIERINL